MEIFANSTLPVKLIWLLLAGFMSWSWFSMAVSSLSLARINRAARSRSEARHPIIDRIYAAGRVAVASLPDMHPDERAKRASAAMHRNARSLLEAAPRGAGGLNAIAATAPLLAALGSALQLQDAFFLLLATKSSNLLYLFSDVIVALALVAGALIVVIPIVFFLRIYERRLVFAERRVHARIEKDLPEIIALGASKPGESSAHSTPDVTSDGGAWSPPVAPPPLPVSNGAP